MITWDRDFYIASMIRRNFPEEGWVSVYEKSLPDHPECPPVKGKVRAKMHINGMVFKPIKLASGKEMTEIFMITSVDIAGWVPRALIN